MNTFLDMALGLILVFLTVSMVVSAVQEVCSSILRVRAAALERGLARFLTDPSGTTTALLDEIKSHPLITTLGSKSVFPGVSSFASYIPPEAFSNAVISVASKALPATATAADIMNAVKTWADGHNTIPFAQGVSDLVVTAETDVDTLRQTLETWFNGAMDRIGGVYKRESQIMSIAFGLLVAAALNINAFHIVQQLQANETLRLQIAAAATKFGGAANPPDLKLAITSIWDLIGWTHPVNIAEGVKAGVLGWIVTGLASALGAPFWFDLLKQVVNVRGTGPKPSSSANQTP